MRGKNRRGGDGSQPINRRTASLSEPNWKTKTQVNSDLITLITAARQKVLNTIMLVEASLSRITPYDVNQNYTPEEMEPYDAMSGRFIRAIEGSLKFFRTYERYLFVESSDTIRDLLNRMATVDLITST